MTTLKRFARNKGGFVAALFLLLVIAAGLFAPHLAPHPFDKPDLLSALSPPSSTHWFGTDNFGRDVLSRVIYGARISMLVALAVVGVSFLIGVPLGIMAGLVSWLEGPVMRVVDLLFAFPGVLLAIAIAAALGPGLTNAMLAVIIWTIPVYARFSRSLVLSIKEQEYVEAARALGNTTWGIAWRHVLPNMLGSLAALSTVQIANTMLTASALSFLGLGAQPPSPEWGAMMAAARDYLRDAWWMVLFPGVAIVMVVFAFNRLSEAVTDLVPRG